MELTQAEYKLFTKENVTYSEEDWLRIVTVALARLARFLCLEELPVDGSGALPDDFKMLLANFIAGTLRFAGNGTEITSKHIRNFTINFRSSAASNAFTQISAQYPDLVAEYSQCDEGFAVEGKARYCCGRV